MTHNTAVFIGGFINGKRLVRRVQKELEAYFDNVTAITLSEYLNNTKRYQGAIRDSTLVVHSAAAIVINNSIKPSRLVLYSPPLPRSKSSLTKSALLGIVDNFKPSVSRNNEGGLSTSVVYLTSHLAELFRHPIIAWRIFTTTQSFNTINALETTSINHVFCYWFNEDRYYQLKPNERALADGNKLKYKIINGAHDQITLSPAATLKMSLGSTDHNRPT